MAAKVLCAPWRRHVGLCEQSKQTYTDVNNKRNGGMILIKVYGEKSLFHIRITWCVVELTIILVFIYIVCWWQCSVSLFLVSFEEFVQWIVQIGRSEHRIPYICIRTTFHILTFQYLFAAYLSNYLSVLVNNGNPLEFNDVWRDNLALMNAVLTVLVISGNTNLNPI